MAGKAHRSAKTGRYVSKATVARHPRTTATETRTSRGSSGGAHQRSAVTGRYVTKATAKRHPDTTITQGG